jgi:hypothetical protein
MSTDTNPRRADAEVKFALYMTALAIVLFSVVLYLIYL